MVIMKVETEIKLKEIRMRFEGLIQTWNNTEMWFQERWFQVPCVVEISIDDWGVRVSLKSEHLEEPFTVSGRWDILIVRESGMGAMYCGWTIDKEMIYPELGISA